MPPYRSRTSSHILIVDDEIIARRKLAKMLKAKNRKISLAISGKNAFTKVSKAKRDIDVILMDIRMPGELDGIEAVRRIQELRCDIPIILLTAFANDPEYRRRVKEANLRITSRVDKPVVGSNKEKLERVLDEELKKKKIRVEIKNKLRENGSPVDLQTLLKELVSSHEVDLVAEIIQGIIEWLHPSNDLNTDDLFPYLNFVAYENQKAELEKDYPGQYVAFLDGDFVGNHEDRSELIKTVYQEHKRTDIFITQIEGPTVIKLRRPRRVIH